MTRERSSLACGTKKEYACAWSEPEVTSSKTGSDWKWQGHVFYDGKPLTRGPKKHRGLRWAFGIGVRSYNPRWRRLDKKTPIFFKKKMPFNGAFFLIYKRRRTQVVNDTCPRKRVQSRNWIRWLATTMSRTMNP